MNYHQIERIINLNVKLFQILCSYHFPIQDLPTVTMQVSASLSLSQQVAWLRSQLRTMVSTNIDINSKFQAGIDYISLSSSIHGGKSYTHSLVSCRSSGPVLHLSWSTEFLPCKILISSNTSSAQQELGLGSHTKLCFCIISSPQRYLPCFMSMAMSSFSPFKFYLALLYV